MSVLRFSYFCMSPVYQDDLLCTKTEEQGIIQKKKTEK